MVEYKKVLQEEKENSEDKMEFNPELVGIMSNVSVILLCVDILFSILGFVYFNLENVVKCRDGCHFSVCLQHISHSPPKSESVSWFTVISLLSVNQKYAPLSRPTLHFFSTQKARIFTTNTVTAFSALDLFSQWKAESSLSELFGIQMETIDYTRYISKTV